MRTLKNLLFGALILCSNLSYGQLSIEGNNGFQAPTFTQLNDDTWGKVDPMHIYHNVPDGMDAGDLYNLEAGKTASVTNIVRDSSSWAFLPGVDGFDLANTQWYIMKEGLIVPTMTRLSLPLPVKDEWMLVFVILYMFFFISYGISREVRKKSVITS